MPQCPHRPDRGYGVYGRRIRASRRKYGYGTPRSGGGILPGSNGFLRGKARNQ